jgi:hypothetical protein
MQLPLSQIVELVLCRLLSVVSLDSACQIFGCILLEASSITEHAFCNTQVTWPWLPRYQLDALHFLMTAWLLSGPCRVEGMEHKVNFLLLLAVVWSSSLRDRHEFKALDCICLQLSINFPSMRSATDSEQISPMCHCHHLCRACRCSR